MVSQHTQERLQFLTMAYRLLKYLGYVSDLSSYYSPHHAPYFAHDDLLPVPQTWKDGLCVSPLDLLCSRIWYILLTNFLITFRPLLKHKLFKRCLPWPLQLKERPSNYLPSHFFIFFQYHLVCLPFPPPGKLHRSTDSTYLPCPRVYLPCMADNQLIFLSGLTDLLSWGSSSIFRISLILDPSVNYLSMTYIALELSIFTYKS